MASRLSLPIFVLAAFMFLLPWVSVTCGRTEVATLSGLQMVTGFEVKTNGAVERFGPEVLAIAALSCSLLGMGLFFLRGKIGAIARALPGVAGFFLLLALKSNIDSAALKSGQGLVLVNYLPAFWITLSSFLGAALVSLFGLGAGLIHKPQVQKQNPEDVDHGGPAE